MALFTSQVPSSIDWLQVFESEVIELINDVRQLAFRIHLIEVGCMGL